MNNRCRHNTLARQLLLLGLFFLFSCLYGTDSLQRGIENRDWQALKSLFTDNSYLTLKHSFSPASTIRVTPSGRESLSYSLKYSDYGEIGTILFSRSGNGFKNLQIVNRIRPLYFLDQFREYPVSETIHLQSGEAHYYFYSGTFYQSPHCPSLVFFNGVWRFRITPSDDEEKRTLQQLYRKDYFELPTISEGIFILPEKDLLSALSPSPASQRDVPGEGHLFRVYRHTFGVHAPGFREEWYLLPSRNNHIAIIAAKEPGDYYYYYFDPDSIPDTHLIHSGSNQTLLYYNSTRGLKIQRPSPNKIHRIQLHTGIRPGDQWMKGDISIYYRDHPSIREFHLHPSLRIEDGPQVVGMSFDDFTSSNRYLIYHPPGKQPLKLTFHGKIPPQPAAPESSRTGGSVASKNRDEDFFMLHRSDNFYPNPGNHFFKATTTLRIPRGFSCLAPGNGNHHEDGDGIIHTFKSRGTKGIGIAVGRFQRVLEYPGNPGLVFHETPDVKLQSVIDPPFLQEGLAFFLRHFGPLDYTNLNILFRYGTPEGGISYNGFIVINLRPPPPPDSVFTEKKIGTRTINPTLLQGKPEEQVLHEIAHQWFGGIISWQTFQDLWLTEGLAQFAALYYAKHHLPTKRFHSVLRRLNRWVRSHNEFGPIGYGIRLQGLGEGQLTYQSIVYNKSALVFLMLSEILGEEDFMKRLRSVLHEHRYESMTGSQFIRAFSRSNTLIQRFLQQWIYTRQIPVIRLKLNKSHPDYDHRNRKRIVVTVSQEGKPMVFPLSVEITTDTNDSTIRTFVMKEQSRVIVLSSADPIKRIASADHLYPWREK